MMNRRRDENPYHSKVEKNLRGAIFWSSASADLSSKCIPNAGVLLDPLISSPDEVIPETELDAGERANWQHATRPRWGEG